MIGNDSSAFTFWVGDTLCAAALPHVLSIEQHTESVHPTPFRIRGLIGALRYRGSIVPVFDLTLLVGMALRSEQKEELLTVLSAREQDHIDWLDALIASVRDATPFTKARDPTQCAFGKWYSRFETRDRELATILARFDEPHRRIHALADRMLDLSAEGRVEHALEQLSIERHTTLMHLRRLFAKARRQIRDSMKTVLLFLTCDGGTPVLALRLDEIGDIVSYSSDRLLSAGGLGNVERDELVDVFPNYIEQPKGPDCLLMDAERLVGLLTRGMHPAGVAAGAGTASGAVA